MLNPLQWQKNARPGDGRCARVQNYRWGEVWGEHLWLHHKHQVLKLAEGRVCSLQATNYQVLTIDEVQQGIIKHQYFIPDSFSGTSRALWPCRLWFQRRSRGVFWKNPDSGRGQTRRVLQPRPTDHLQACHQVGTPAGGGRSLLRCSKGGVRPLWGESQEGGPAGAEEVVLCCTVWRWVQGGSRKRRVLAPVRDIQGERQVLCPLPICLPFRSCSQATMLQPVSEIQW